MPRPRSDIRPRVLDAARARFLREGVDGASLRGIARDAGTNIGMIYYYFPTKDDLFFGVVDQVYDGLLEGVGEALASDVPVRERIRRLYSRFEALSDVELHVVLLLLRDAFTSSERTARLVERFKRGHIALLLSTLADGAQEGLISDRFHPALLIWTTLGHALVPQIILRLAGEHLPFSNVPTGEALTADLLDLLFSGIGAGGSDEAD